MGLLKTVFEVNLGLFGKKSADRFVMLFLRAPDVTLIMPTIAPANEHSFSSSFVTTSAPHRSPTSRLR